MSVTRHLLSSQRNMPNKWMNEKGHMENPSGRPTVESKPVSPENFPGVVIRRHPVAHTKFVVWVHGVPKHEFSSLEAAQKHVRERTAL